MADQSLGAVLQRMRVLAEADPESTPDAQLIERFVNQDDGNAFAILVHRHGPMVRAVCRRELRDGNDVDDAFQATFLVLARKAGALRHRTRVAGWLHGVAYRIARKARVQSVRRHTALVDVPEPSRPAQLDDLTWRDLQPILDEEIQRLPAKYREPFVLCYLEGLTYSAAAQQLQVPPGTVCGRLDRARQLLRSRLMRRGLTLSTGLLGALLAQGPAAAAVPAAVLQSTIEASLAFAGKGAGAISSQALLLAHAALRSLLAAQLKLAAGIVLALMVLLGGGLGLGHYLAAEKPNPARPVPESSPENQRPPQSQLVPVSREAHEVVERAIRAAGGREKVAALKAAAWTVVWNPTADTERRQHCTALGYDRYRMEAEHPQNGELVRTLYLVNRNAGWRRDSKGSVVEFPQTALLANKERLYAQRVGELLTLLQGNEVVLTLAGTLDLGVRRLARIRVEQRERPTVHLDFDRDTGLLHRSEMALTPRADGVRSTLVYTFEEYREFDGLKHHTRLTLQLDEEPAVVWHIRDFRLLDQIDEQLFARP
jgi:RNA polymerase sigma factor (sigma-70 family)